MIVKIMAAFHSTSASALLFSLITSTCRHGENPIACGPTPLIKVDRLCWANLLVASYYLKSATILRLFGGAVQFLCFLLNYRIANHNPNR